MPPWTYPSHWFHIQCYLRLIQATGSVGVVQLHCISLQRSLHFPAYTLAIQSMVNAFMQHSSKYPSRYIIVSINIADKLSSTHLLQYNIKFHFALLIVFFQPKHMYILSHNVKITMCCKDKPNTKYILLQF
jgi:hypothetical protein